MSTWQGGKKEWKTITKTHGAMKWLISSWIIYFPEYADDLWPEHKTIGENGELPVLWDDDGDPIFPQRYDAFPLPEDELANKLIRSLIGTAQKHSGWLWN